MSAFTPAPGGTATAGAMELIEEIILESDTTPPIPFNIPQTFRHLRLIVMARATSVSTVVNLGLAFNNDNGANYDLTYLRGLNSAASAGQAAASTEIGILIPDAANALPTIFGSSDILIPNYRNALEKTVLVNQLCFYSGVANEYSEQRHAIWQNTAAILNLLFFLPAGGDLQAGSTFSLYGVL